jgi:FMN-dependent NADH-azoreductase
MTMKILHVSCSPRGEAAESCRLSRMMIDLLLEKYPGAIVMERPLGGNVVPHVDADYALSQQSLADVSQEGSMLISDALIDELASADILVIGTPMHNFTVPSSLKAWIDHVVRVRRTFDVSSKGKVALLDDRPVLIAVASGGRFSGERTRQPDFLTPYLRAVFSIIGLHDLTFFSVEGTSSGAEAVSKSRTQAYQAVNEHFATNRVINEIRDVSRVSAVPKLSRSDPARQS